MELDFSLLLTKKKVQGRLSNEDAAVVNYSLAHGRTSQNCHRAISLQLEGPIRTILNFWRAYWALLNLPYGPVCT